MFIPGCLASLEELSLAGPSDEMASEPAKPTHSFKQFSADPRIIDDIIISAYM